MACSYALLNGRLYLFMVYKTGRPALKFCWLPFPTVRKVQIHTLCSDLHVVNYMIVSVSCSDFSRKSSNNVVISGDVDSHQIVLSSLVMKAGNICFEFQPIKCVSIHFNGRHVVYSTQFSMNNGNTVNICNINCTKFLGKTIGVSL